MLIVRYLANRPDASPQVGLMSDAGLHPLEVAGLADLLSQPLDQIQKAVLTAASGGAVHGDSVRLLAPVDGRTEVWAAGVTYQDSRDARVEESERASTVYTDVYDADRPELFLKSAAWRAVGPGGTVRIRADGGVSVPEPELTVIGNAHGEIVGYTVCNDMSSRSIEAANPLYLPQAKIYNGACAIGPGIRPAWELADPHDLAITASIVRGAQLAWQGSTHTSRLRRTVPDLVGWLTLETSFPEGFALATGTGTVPDWPFSLAPGDEITIDIDQIGTLTNTVGAA
jgi:2-dehydro-3-deoxy-D-arabinonate dehydratase